MEPSKSGAPSRNDGRGPKKGKQVVRTVRNPDSQYRSNLTQAFVVIGATLLGTGAGIIWALSRKSEPPLWALAGGLVGLIGSMVLTGLIRGRLKARSVSRRRPTGPTGYGS